MRFSVRKKLILIGTIISFSFFIAAFSLSFFIFRSYTIKNFIKSIDNSIAELEFAIGDQQSLDQMSSIVEAVYDTYLEHINDEKNFSSREEEIEYYTSVYPMMYDQPGIIGMSYDKLTNTNSYLDISSSLACAAISAGGRMAYAGIIISKDISLDNGRFLYLFDSKFRFNQTEEGHPFGSDYKLKEDDLDENPNSKYGGYIIDGKKARVVDFHLGEVLDNDITITAFIEYDDKAVNDSILVFGIIDAISLLAVLILLTIAYILFSHFVVVKNITTLTNSTKEFTNGVISGDVLKSVNPNIKSKDEIGLLSESFIQMEDEIINYTEKIKQATAEKEKINAELAIATSIQLESLPKNSLNDKNILINTYIKSAKEVGGDFYDYFYIDNNHLAIIISDVSGKGIPAALFMMRSKELIKSKLISNKNLEDVCFEVNNELLNNNEAGLFITAFIGVLDINTKTLDIVSCGHEKPFLLSNGNAMRLALKSNFILGGVKNYKYHNDSIKLNEGDRLFLHTDGLNESIDDNEIEFGYDRIACCLKDNYYNKLSDILINLDKKLNEFTNNKEQFDDITMLILEMKSSKLEFSFNNPNYEIIEEVTNKFSDYYSYFDKNIISKVSTVIDEVLNNYISYEKKEDLIINISFDYIDDKLVILFKNNGTSFNPLLKEDKYIKDDTNLLPGGLGITIVKNLSNDVIYDRIDDYNVLKVFFNIK